MSCPLHALHSTHPVPPFGLGHSLSSSRALPQDSLVPDSLSSTRTYILPGSVAGYHCPLWPARMDAGRRLWGLAGWCQAFGAKAHKGPRYDPPP